MMYVLLVILVSVSSLMALFSLIYAIKNNDSNAFFAQLAVIGLLSFAIVFTIYLGGN